MSALPGLWLLLRLLAAAAALASFTTGLHECATPLHRCLPSPTAAVPAAPALPLWCSLLRGASTALLEGAGGPAPCPDGNIECAQARVRRAQMLLDEAKSQAAAFMRAQGKTQLDAKRVAGSGGAAAATQAQPEQQARQAQPAQQQGQAPEPKSSGSELAAEATAAAATELAEWEGEWRQQAPQQAEQEPQQAEAQEQQGAAGEEQQGATQAAEEAAAQQPEPAAAAATEDGGQEQAQAEPQPAAAGSSSAKSPYLQALEGCQDLECLTRAEAEAPRQPGQYRFPHFYIVGWQVRGLACCCSLTHGRAALPGGTCRSAMWAAAGPSRPSCPAASSCTPPLPAAPAAPLNEPQKCATTSLYHHLKEHPQVLRSVDKVRRRRRRVCVCEGAVWPPPAFPCAALPLAHARPAETTLATNQQPQPPPTSCRQEPEFFSDTCGYDPAACPPQDTQQYLWRQLKLGEYLAAGGGKGVMEASTHYGRNGPALAARLYKVRVEAGGGGCSLAQ